MNSAVAVLDEEMAESENLPLARMPQDCTVDVRLELRELTVLLKERGRHQEERDDATKQSLNAIHTELRAVKSEVGELREGQTQLRSEMSSIAPRVKELEHKVDTQNDRLTELSAQVKPVVSDRESVIKYLITALIGGLVTWLAMLLKSA